MILSSPYLYWGRCKGQTRAILICSYLLISLQPFCSLRKSRSQPITPTFFHAGPLFPHRHSSSLLTLWHFSIKGPLGTDLSNVASFISTGFLPVYLLHENHPAYVTRTNQQKTPRNASWGSTFNCIHENKWAHLQSTLIETFIKIRLCL